MGRKKKYVTDEEIRLARNERRMRYYLKNKDTEQKASLKRYYERKSSKI
jgi:hypothetical protein